MDKNHDDKISFEELLNYMCDWPSKLNPTELPLSLILLSMCALYLINHSLMRQEINSVI